MFNEKGFTHIEIIIVAVVGLTLIGTGILVYKHNDHKATKLTASDNTKTTEPTKSTKNVLTSPAPTNKSVTVTPSNTSPTYTPPQVSPTSNSASSGSSASTTPQQIYETFSYEPIQNPSDPLSNACHDSSEQIACPEDGEGLIETGSGQNTEFSVNIPAGWTLDSADYEYANSNNQPVDGNSNWNAQGNIPISTEYQGSTVSLGLILGTLIESN